MTAKSILQSLTCAGIGLLMSLTATAQELEETEKPLLTLACISDIHTERELITNINNVALRNSFTKTLNRIRQEENIDVLLLGGDCTSDATIPQVNWEKVRQLIANYSRKAFNDASNTPVLYVTGNHDYEVANWYDLPKPYNAGDYYTFPMHDDIGELTAEESFYEEADNTTLGKISLLAAYHYVIHGFDFVILNCGKFQFKDAGHYEYSVESVQWVADKLAEICAEDPNKTVFFALHIPFGDSNSIRSASKGIISSDGEKLLKSTLSKYPNLIMLYGHDHGEDKAYTRAKTSQRVTRYNKNGAVIDTYDKSHVDGQLPEGYVPENSNTTQSFYLRNASNNLYLGYNEYNLAVTNTKTAISFYTTASKTFNATINAKHPTDPDGNSKLHIGSNGYFSGGTASNIYIYTAETNENKLTGTRTEELEAGRSYIIVSKNGSNYYALSNQTYNSGTSQRMDRIQVTLSSDLETFTLATANNAIEWVFEEVETEENPVDQQTKWWITSYENQSYLGFNSYNLGLSATANMTEIEWLNAATGSCALKVQGGGSEANGNYVISSSNGNFSANNTAQPTYLYKVVQMNNDGIVCQKALVPESGATYVIVAQNAKDGSKYYALTNQEVTVGSGHRMSGILVNPTNDQLTLSTSQNQLLWTFSIPTINLADNSFFSAFMGSMRYYYNTIDPGDMPVETPNIVQALLVYVYKDRVELHMKNYNKYGTINGITVNRYLVPYISYREVADPEATSINTVELKDYYLESQGTYDLLGRSSTLDTKGIKIMNGEKVLIK